MNIKLIFISFIIMHLISCGKNEDIPTVVSVSNDFRSETHTAKKSEALQSEQNGNQGLNVNSAAPIATSNSGSGSNERQTKTSSSDGLSQSKEQLMCRVLNISETYNKDILAQRNFSLEVIRKIQNGAYLSEIEKLKFVKILMKYRLLGKLKYLYVSSRYSSSEIENKIDQAAKRLLKSKGMVEKCFYIEKRNGSYYEIGHSIESNQCESEIKRRIQPIAPMMVASQVAEESGWGTSRFAKEGNNLFGLQFRFSDVNEPKRRPYCMIARKDPNRCVYRFVNIRDAIVEYYRFLNAGSYQTEFRKIRGTRNYPYDMNRSETMTMISGLVNYAENANYVEDISEKYHQIEQFRCD